MTRLFLLLLIPLVSQCSPGTDKNGIFDEYPVIAHVRITSGDFDREHSLVSIDLDEVTQLPDHEIALLEVDEDNTKPVAVQVHTSDRRRLYWQIQGDFTPGASRLYKLVHTTELAEVDQHMMVEAEHGALIIRSYDAPLLQYQASVMYPPGNMPAIYKRSGYIHPLYSPSGQILTRIQPEDHPHHYGIWNPWTKTSFRDTEIDFWNLGKALGTIRHAGLLYKNSGAVFASLGALHEHIAWPETEHETLAINEQFNIKVWPLGEHAYMADFSFILSPEEPITLEEYRYGGFCLRGTEAWTRQNTDFITSEGLHRDQADGERARWCLVQGRTDDIHAGILFMGHPANYNHPEPLRIWPSDANNGRGDIFINFSPTRNTDWQLHPGNSYLLRYRIMVFDGSLDTDRAEKYWNDYANPPQITIEKLL